MDAGDRARRARRGLGALARRPTRPRDDPRSGDRHHSSPATRRWETRTGRTPSSGTASTTGGTGSSASGPTPPSCGPLQPPPALRGDGRVLDQPLQREPGRHPRRPHDHRRQPTGGAGPRPRTVRRPPPGQRPQPGDAPLPRQRDKRRQQRRGSERELRPGAARAAHDGDHRRRPAVHRGRHARGGLDAVGLVGEHRRRPAPVPVQDRHAPRRAGQHPRRSVRHPRPHRDRQGWRTGSGCSTSSPATRRRPATSPTSCAAASSPTRHRRRSSPARPRSTRSNDTAIAPVLRHIFHSAAFASGPAQQGPTGVRGLRRLRPGDGRHRRARSRRRPGQSPARLRLGLPRASRAAPVGPPSARRLPRHRPRLDLRRRAAPTLGDGGRAHGHLAGRMDLRRRTPSWSRPARRSARGSKAWPAACSVWSPATPTTATATCPPGPRTRSGGSRPSGTAPGGRTGPTGPTPTSPAARSPPCSGRSRAAPPAGPPTG